MYHTTYHLKHDGTTCLQVYKSCEWIFTPNIYYQLFPTTGNTLLKDIILAIFIQPQTTNGCTLMTVQFQGWAQKLYKQGKHIYYYTKHKINFNYGNGIVTPLFQ